MLTISPNHDHPKPSMSIHNGTQQLLALVQYEVEKAVAKAREDLFKETEPRFAALENQRRITEESATTVRLDLGNALSSSAVNAEALTVAQTRLETLGAALEKAGFAMDTDTINFGPMVSALAFEVQQLACTPSDSPMRSLLHRSISEFGAADILQAVKDSLDRTQKVLDVWKTRCGTAEKERDTLQAKATEAGTLLISKVSEIETLHKEIALLKAAAKTAKSPPRMICKRRQIQSDSEEDASSDSDIPLATSSRVFAQKIKPVSVSIPPRTELLSPAASPVILPFSGRTSFPSPTLSPVIPPSPARASISSLAPSPIIASLPTPTTVPPQTVETSKPFLSRKTVPSTPHLPARNPSLPSTPETSKSSDAPGTSVQIKRTWTRFSIPAVAARAPLSESSQPALATPEYPGKPKSSGQTKQTAGSTPALAVKTHMTAAPPPAPESPSKPRSSGQTRQTPGSTPALAVKTHMAAASPPTPATPQSPSVASRPRTSSTAKAPPPSTPAPACQFLDDTPVQMRPPPTPVSESPPAKRRRLSPDCKPLLAARSGQSRWGVQTPTTSTPVNKSPSTSVSETPLTKLSLPTAGPARSLTPTPGSSSSNLQSLDSSFMPRNMKLPSFKKLALPTSGPSKHTNSIPPKPTNTTSQPGQPLTLPGKPPSNASTSKSVTGTAAIFPPKKLPSFKRSAPEDSSTHDSTPPAKKQHIKGPTSNQPKSRHSRDTFPFSNPNMRRTLKAPSRSIDQRHKPISIPMKSLGDAAPRRLP